jgi:hypothetical protein
MNSCLFFTHLLSDMGEIWYRGVHIMLLIDSEARKSQHREGHTVLMVINEMIRTGTVKLCYIVIVKNALGYSLCNTAGSTPFGVSSCW